MKCWPNIGMEKFFYEWDLICIFLLVNFVLICFVRVVISILTAKLSNKLRIELIKISHFSSSNP